MSKLYCLLETNPLLHDSDINRIMRKIAKMTQVSISQYSILQFYNSAYVVVIGFVVGLDIVSLFFLWYNLFA